MWCWGRFSSARLDVPVSRAGVTVLGGRCWVVVGVWRQDAVLTLRHLQVTDLLRFVSDAITRVVFSDGR